MNVLSIIGSVVVYLLVLFVTLWGIYYAGGRIRSAFSSVFSRNK